MRPLRIERHFRIPHPWHLIVYKHKHTYVIVLIRSVMPVSGLKFRIERIYRKIGIIIRSYHNFLNIPQLCEICGEFFTEKTNKNRHKRAQHSATVRKFRCLICFAAKQLQCLFYSRYSLKIHSNRKHDGKVTGDIIYIGNYQLF